MVRPTVKHVYVITYPTPKEVKTIIDIKKDDIVIAVDQALLYCVEQGIHVHLAVGDFDSLIDKQLLVNVLHEILPVEKDVTDTFYALQKAYEISQDVTLIGGAFGNRIEHMYVHMMLCHHFKSLVIRTEYSTITRISKNTTIDFKGFINIFPYPEAVISLVGFKYPLQHYHMKPLDTLGISNYLVETSGEMIIHSGAVLLIETIQ
jgi:thiamine pyrophosphokinase